MAEGVLSSLNVFPIPPHPRPPPRPAHLDRMAQLGRRCSKETISLDYLSPWHLFPSRLAIKDRSRLEHTYGTSIIDIGPLRIELCGFLRVDGLRLVQQK